MKKSLLCVAILSVLSFTAQSEPSVKDLVEDYKINQKKSPSFSTSYNHHRAGVKWNVGGTCGDFDMDFSIGNTLSKKELQRMWNNWLTQAKKAFDPATLLALAFQRANPDLYEILQNGIIEARGVFDEDMNVCKNIQDTVMDQAPGGWIEKLSTGEEFNKRAKRAYDGARVDVGDVVDFSSDAGDKGFTLLEKKFGGRGQRDAPIIGLASQAGFNIAADRTLSSNNSKIDLNNVSAITSSSKKVIHPFLNYFSRPSEVTRFVTEIVGETKLASRKGSNAITNTKNVGLTKILNDEEKRFYDGIDEIVDVVERGVDITLVKSDINAFNTHIQGTQLTPSMIQELSLMPSYKQESYKHALAREYAFLYTMDKTFVARRIIIMGSKETSITEAKPVYDMLMTKVKELDSELELVETEHRLRSLYAGSASTKLYERAMLNRTKGIIVDAQEGVWK